MWHRVSTTFPCLLQSPRVLSHHFGCSNLRQYSTSQDKNILFSNEGRVLIVGGGVGGLTLALALRKHGISSDVVDIGRDLSARDNGLLLSTNATYVLKELGVYDAIKKEGQEIKYRAAMNEKGNEFGRVDLSNLGKPRGVEAIGIHRQTLYSALSRECSKKLANKASINIASRVNIGAIEPVGAAVRVRFLGGRVAEHYDLVVGADGAASRVRSLYFKDETVSRVTNWVVASGVVERPFLCDDNIVTEMTGAGKRLVILPLNNNKVYVWGAFESKYPIQSIKEGEKEVNEFISNFTDFGGNAPHVLYALERNSPTCKLEIPFEVRMKKVAKPPVVLIGDAAHTLIPNVLQGAALAMEDALVLSRTLTNPAYTTIADSLEAYNTQRESRVKMVQDLAWDLNSTMRSRTSKILQPIALSTFAQTIREKKLINFK